MKLLDFIFLHRNWAKDKPCFRRRLRRLFYEDLPASIVIFPEGTTICAESVAKSNRYAEANDLYQPKWLLVPRVTGLQYALDTVGENLDGIWDLTVGYEGVPEGAYPEDYYGLCKLFGYRSAPPIVHIRLRYYPISRIPYKDPATFTRWLYGRFEEKDQSLNNFMRDGQFSGRVLSVFQVAHSHLIYAMYLVIPVITLIFYFLVRYIYLKYFL